MNGIVVGTLYLRQNGQRNFQHYWPLILNRDNTVVCNGIKTEAGMTLGALAVQIIETALKYHRESDQTVRMYMELGDQEEIDLIYALPAQLSYDIRNELESARDYMDRDKARAEAAANDQHAAA